MEFLLRLMQGIVKIVFYFFNHVVLLFWSRTKPKKFPPIRNELCSKSLCEVLALMRDRKLKSYDLVKAYIERIKYVNPLINAVIEDRYVEAIRDAIRADELIAGTSNNNLQRLFERFPLLGVPFTVKESCGVRGMSITVGSIQRNGMKSTSDGETVGLLRTAGGIPLLISATPEYCFSIETNTLTGGKCVNPYDPRRTAGGSSGGEGALNGAGATLFGVGSDIAGSIRIPSLFNGVFGHKPTGHLVSVRGHFPNSSDPDYEKYLQIGPITRFACDLILIMNVMAGPRADLMNHGAPIETKDIKIFYSPGFQGFNGLLHANVAFDIKFSISNAVKFFERIGAKTERVNFSGFWNSTEIALSAIVRLQDFPYLMNTSNEKKIYESLKEFVKAIFGMSPYTRDGLVFEIMRRTSAFMPVQNLAKYYVEMEALKEEILEVIGDDGVFFFPTFHVPAIHHNISHMPLWGIDYSLIFNVLGFPATHIPMGFDQEGLPVGFQVVAAPYRDKLCIQIAMELEAEFGGWVPPT